MLEDKKLEQMFDSVALYYADFIVKNPRFPVASKDRCERIALALMKEANEVHDLFNWKWWKKEKPFDRDEYIEENVDCLHFVLEGLIEAGVTPQELFTKFMKKASVNRDRQLSGY